MCLYLYGIAHFPEGESWPCPEGVREIKADGLSALVRTMDDQVPVLDAGTALAHERVLEGVMARGTVLPCSFYTIANDEDQVRHLLQRIREPLLEAVERLRGKEECGLKIYWLRDAFIRELEQENPALQELREQGGVVDRDLAIEVGQMVQARVERWKQELEPSIEARLLPYCHDLKFNSIIGHRMIVNAAFLVERDREQALREGVLAFNDLYNDKLEIRYVSGLPPYNFVDLRVSLAGQMEGFRETGDEA